MSQALTTTPTATPVPPPPPWWGSCPPPDWPIMQCYRDVRQLQAFLVRVITDLINSDPAIIQAIITQLAKPNNLGPLFISLLQTDPSVVTAIITALNAQNAYMPLAGVTTGVDATAGNVGQWVLMSQAVSYTAAAQSQTVTLGQLLAGDWDYWIYGLSSTLLNDVTLQLTSLPAGFTSNLWTQEVGTTGEMATDIVTTTGRALISAASNVQVTLETNQLAAGTAAGTFTLSFMARRRR